MRKAFTIVELIIAITILVILASLALTSGSSLIKQQKLNNAFNRTISMIQQARNSALAARGGTISSYQIQFLPPTVTPGNFRSIQIAVISTQPQNPNEPPYDLGAENLEIRVTGDLPSQSACGADSNIAFASSTGQVTLLCVGGTPPNPFQFRIEISEIGNRTRSRAFTIHRASGIPQIAF